MLVLHPRISTLTDCTGVFVGVSVGVTGGNVATGEGVSVLVEILTGVNVELGAAISPGVGDRMIGVAVMTPGVRDGMGVQTGNGWGATLQASHPESRRIQKIKAKIFFMPALYPYSFVIKECLADVT